MFDYEGFAEHLRGRPQRYQSASEYVSVMLREAIMSGAVAPGSALGQEELAKAFSVSRMPVRDALRILEAEGLVSFRAHHGFTVVEFSASQFIEVAQIRYALESLALRTAIEAHTPQSLRLASDLLVELNNAEKSANLQSRPTLHRQFHLLLYGPCGMDRLLSLIDANLIWSESLSRIGSSHFPFVMERDIHEHEELLDAVKEGHADRACERLHSHIVGQAKAIADRLESLKTDASGSGNAQIKRN